VGVDDARPLLIAVLVVGAYLVGSIPFGVLAARAAGGPDPRTIGSGRTGGTNALRALGRRWALFVVTGDVLKGAGPVLIARLLTGDAPVEVACGVAAVVGATHSVFLRFHGGRGVGTGVGTMLVIFPIAVILATPVFAATILATRYVSLGSLLGSAAIPVVVAAWWLVVNAAVPPIYLAYATVGSGLIWLAHADNIHRLLSGTERKFDLGLLSRDEP
jgi:glycerol-3-phosphate acyltransferase PlsY